MEINFGEPYWINGEIVELSPGDNIPDLTWHCDSEFEEVEILKGEGWHFQWKGGMPYLLKQGMVFDIEQGEYHRLIEGIGTLKCRITTKCQIKKI